MIQKTSFGCLSVSSSFLLIFEFRILKWYKGNKSDLEGSRKVSKEQGEQFAAENGMKFCETSGQENLNVELAFMTV